MRKLSKREFIKYCVWGASGVIIGINSLKAITSNKSAIKLGGENPDLSDLPKAYATELLKKHDPVLFENVQIITMTGGATLTGQSLLVRNGKIAGIGKDIEPAKGETVVRIDGQGKYMIPGLADMHAHLFDDGDFILFLANGVTTARIMHGDPDFLVMREKIIAKSIIGPNLIISSPSIGDPIFHYENAKQAGADVKKYVEKKYDFIKVCNVTEPIFKEIIAVAKELGVKVAGHIPPQVKIKTIIDSQMHSLEHFFMLNPKKPENLKLIAEAGIWHCPTLAVYETSKANKTELLKHETMKYIFSDQIEEWKALSMEYLQQNTNLPKFKEFVAMGAKIILGTDCRVQYVVPGFSVHRELQLLVKNGMSNYEALKAGTANAADCLGNLSTSGTIEVNKIADLVMLEKNPLDDISNSQTIAGVMLGGAWIPKTKIDEMLSKLADERKGY